MAQLRSGAVQKRATSFDKLLQPLRSRYFGSADCGSYRPHYPARSLVEVAGITMRVSAARRLHCSPPAVPSVWDDR